MCKKKSPGIDKIIHKYLIFIKEASENNRKKILFNQWHIHVRNLKTEAIIDL